MVVGTIHHSRLIHRSGLLIFLIVSMVHHASWFGRTYLGEEYADSADPVAFNERLARLALFFVASHIVQKNPIQPEAQVTRDKTHRDVTT